MQIKRPTEQEMASFIAGSLRKHGCHIDLVSIWEGYIAAVFVYQPRPENPMSNKMFNSLTDILKPYWTDETRASAALIYAGPEVEVVEDGLLPEADRASWVWSWNEPALAHLSDDERSIHGDIRVHLKISHNSHMVICMWKGFLVGLLTWGIIERDAYDLLRRLLPDGPGDELIADVFQVN